MPTALRIVKGNPGKRPINEDEPTPPAASIDPPDHLSAAADEHWRKIAPVLSDTKLLSRLDLDSLAAYCEAFATWVDAKEKLRGTGSVVKAPSGYPMINPYMGIARQAQQDMTRLAAEFGMTPSARSRLSVKATDVDRANSTDGGAADRLLG